MQWQSLTNMMTYGSGEPSDDENIPLKLIQNRLNMFG